MAVLQSYKVGDIAPDFTLLDEQGKTFHLYEELEKGNTVMLIFYPGDMTPGCTGQLCGVRDIYTKFKEKGISVYGVNHADAQSHQKFISKYEFPFPILVDTDRNVSEQYGQLKFMFGHKSIKRGVYVIGSDKIIRYKKHGYQDNDEILALNIA